MMNRIIRGRRLRFFGLSLLIACVPVAIATDAARAVHAQVSTVHLSSPTADKLDFEVASVRQNKTDGKASMNVSPTTGADFSPTGGLYSAKNIVLVSYIAFAYKLTNKQLQSVVSRVPWAMEDRFDIEARAEGNPTKDQYRSMMRSLLAERFKLAAHFETREVPIFALVLAKPEKLGQQLRLHQASDPVCSEPASTPAPGAARGLAEEDAAGFPESCRGIRRMKPSAPGRLRNGGRDVPMTLVAGILTGVGNVDRPMFDQTGIKGNVDFSLEWGLVAANLPSGEEFHPDDSAPTFEQALKEQLGIKMLRKNGPADFFIVDHVEHPSAN
jgi:uncharacterized protein (TIGR03435 family)